MFKPEGQVEPASCQCVKANCQCKQGKCCKPGETCCGDDRTCDKTLHCTGGPCGHDSKTGTI